MTSREVLLRSASAAIQMTFITDKTILLPLNMRETVDPSFWTSPAAAEYASLAQPFHLLQGLTDMFKRVLGDETVLCLQTKFGSLRQVVERSSPQTQCKNVIGDPSDCWICGGAISTDDLGPECEHVFPIAQALVFTGLYEHSLFEQISDEEDTDLTKAYISGLRKEYRWAHRICNQVKNDAHFIKYNGTNFVIDDQLIIDFLNDIVKTKSWGGGNMLCAYLGKNNMAAGKAILQGRVAAIRAACSPIIDTVGRLGLTPQVHAQSTAMFLKQYIANEPDCGIVQEVARTNPTVAGTAGYPTLDPNYSYEVVTRTTYLNDFSNDLFGRYTTMLQGLMGRGGELPMNAAARTAVLASLVEMEHVYKEQVKPKINAIIPNLRYQIMIYLQRLGVKNDELYSRYQVLSSQIPLLILAKIICYGFVESLRAQIDNHKGIQSNPALAAAMRTLVESPATNDLVSNTLGTKAVLTYPVLFNTREEAPREEKVDRVLKTIEEISNIQLLPSNAPFPEYFQAGGTRRRRLNRIRNKKRYNSKSKNKKTRSQRRPKTF
jgi:hypothetical protein